MDKFDMTEIAGLLHVHKEAIAHGPALSHIAAEAYKRLRELNAELDPKPKSTYVPTAFDKEVPPRNVVPEPEAPKVLERASDGEPIIESETPVVERRDL